MLDHMYNIMDRMLKSGEYSSFDMYMDCEDELVANFGYIDAPITYKEGEAL